jgi:hypothetical protein
VVKDKEKEKEKEKKKTKEKLTTERHGYALRLKAKDMKIYE